MDIASIVGRAQRLLLSPAAEWDVIAGEAADIQKIYMNYVGPLIVAAAVAGAIGMSVVGMMSLRMGVGTAFTMMIVQIVMGLVMVYVLAYVINMLAPQFGAKPDMDQAFKLAAYSPTASWVAGLVMIIPALGMLALLGALYSLFLLYVGLPKLMKPAEDKQMVYTLAVVAVMVVIAVVMSVIQASVMPPMMPMMRNY
jgi:Yip1 domain